MKNNETQMSQNNDFDGLVVSENCNARLIPTIISAVDGVKSLRRWRSWWKADTLALDIKSPFTFEFLGLQAKDVVEESDLETALITHLQDFILELGMGFCFEERQKKMLIDDRSCVRKMRDYIIRYRSSKIR